MISSSKSILGIAIIYKLISFPLNSLDGMKIVMLMKLLYIGEKNDYIVI